MILKIIVLIIPATLSQFSGSSYGMRPDVSFNDYNDRFDVDAIVKDQERMYPEPKEHYRRKETTSSSDEERIEAQSLPESELKEVPIQKPFVPVLDMKVNADMEAKDFAYHDKMESDYETDFEKHLKPFQGHRRSLVSLLNGLYGGKVHRRSMDESKASINEVLFHHAVPVKLSIDGYLKLPKQIAN